MVAAAAAAATAAKEEEEGGGGCCCCGGGGSCFCCCCSGNWIMSSHWSDFLAGDWLDTLNPFLSRPLCIFPGLWLALNRGCINLFFLFFPTIYNKDYIHCNTWHSLHSGASVDIVMSSWGLELYRTALDLHLSTSIIGRHPRRPPWDEGCRLSFI